MNKGLDNLHKRAIETDDSYLLNIYRVIQSQRPRDYKEYSELLETMLLHTLDLRREVEDNYRKALENTVPFKLPGDYE